MRNPQTNIDASVRATDEWLLMELVDCSVGRRDPVDAVDNDHIDRRHPASELKTRLIARRGA